MYHQHFGLNGSPFQFTPTPEKVFMSREHREGLAVLEWGLLHEPTGITVLVGDTGVGKTTITCSILARQHANLKFAFLTSPGTSFEQMVGEILSQLGAPQGGTTRAELWDRFSKFLDRAYRGQHIAIVIDEAQQLSESQLEGLRLLSDMDTATERRLQLVLVGQPELMPRVAKMRNLNERIGARAQLHALDPSEAREYVESRLHSKGGNAAKIFAPAALKYLLAKSRGIPRRINVLCHNAMLLAYGAGQKRVELEMAKAAVAEYDGTVTPARSSIREMLPFASPMSRMAIGGTALAALVGIFAIGAIHFVSPVSTTSTALSDTRNDSSFAVNRAPYDQARMNQAMQRQAKGVTANDEGGTASEMSQSQGELAPDQHGRRAVRVQPGDTIAVIAGRYFGGNVDDSVIQKMVEANPQLGDVNRIYPGQVVYLPSPTELSRKDQ